MPPARKHIREVLITACTQDIGETHGPTSSTTKLAKVPTHTCQLFYSLELQQLLSKAFYRRPAGLLSLVPWQELQKFPEPSKGNFTSVKETKLGFQHS